MGCEIRFAHDARASTWRGDRRRLSESHVDRNTVEIIKVLLSLLHTDPAPQGRGSIFFFFHEIASAQNGMGQSRAKTPETRFGRPWQMTSRKTAPHAITHDGTAVTYDMTSPARRRHEIRDNEEYRLRLRRGIIACAEIRRRLSGEKNKCKNKRTHALAYPRGVREASTRTRRVSKPGEGTRHTFLRVSFPDEAP